MKNLLRVNLSKLRWSPATGQALREGRLRCLRRAKWRWWLLAGGPDVARRAAVATGWAPAAWTHRTDGVPGTKVRLSTYIHSLPKNV